MSLRTDCDYIVAEAIKHVLPEEAVKKALKDKEIKRPKKQD